MKPADTKEPSRDKTSGLDAVVRAGLAHHRAGRLREAEAAYMGVLWQVPEHPDALQLLGVIAHQAGKYGIALELIGRAISASPDIGEFHSNYGAALFALGRTDDAIAAYRRAIEVKPKYAQAHHNLGNALRARGELDAAHAAYRRAVRHRSRYRDAKIAIATLQLLRGEFSKGFKGLSDQVKPPPFINRLKGNRPPAWNGAPLAGKTILVYAAEDARDTVQFVRFAPRLQQAGGNVVIACQKALAPLLARAPGVDAIAPEGSPHPHFDVHASVTALPHLLGEGGDRLGGDTAYLDVDPYLVAEWRDRLPANTFNIGLVWAAEHGPNQGPQNALSQDLLTPLLDVPGVAFHALWADAGSKADKPAKSAIDGRAEINSLAIATTDFIANAAALSALDLLIAADGTAVHIAGALGRPVWAMVPIVADWRWMLEGDVSPWYRTVRLFRQDQRDDWPPVVERLRAALVEHIA